MVTRGAYKKIAGAYQKFGGTYNAYHNKNLKGDNMLRKFSNAYENPLPIPCDCLRK